jgi:aldose 1-epimerase
MKIKKQSFGTLPDGAEVALYTLVNAQGMRVTITTYGGAVVSLTAPDRAGTYADVVLGFDALEGIWDSTRSSAVWWGALEPHRAWQVHA